MKSIDIENIRINSRKPYQCVYVGNECNLLTINQSKKGQYQSDQSKNLRQQLIFTTICVTITCLFVVSGHVFRRSIFCCERVSIYVYYLKRVYAWKVFEKRKKSMCQCSREMLRSNEYIKAILCTHALPLHTLALLPQHKYQMQTYSSWSIHICLWTVTFSTQFNSVKICLSL